MDPPPVALALRLSGQDHALEPGREYLLGNAPHCDLRLGISAAQQQAQLRVGQTGAEIVDLGSGCATLVNGKRVERATLAVGDLLRFGDSEAVVVADTGHALIVPVPALRAAAATRRYHAAVRAAAALLRHVGPRTFGAFVARELCRTPWLAASLLLHVVLLLLCWIVFTPPVARRETVATTHVEITAEPAADDPGLAAPPPVVVETADPAFEAPRDTAPQVRPEVERELGETRPMPQHLPPDNSRVAGPPPSSARGGEGTGDGLRGLGSEGFKKTVGGLRESGLEIVFVFDSTGSMTRAIVDTKTTIVQMLAVLQLLVPDARFGLVTYRDRGPRERYLVQQVPLGPDFWRACNFVQIVSADGGGDRPEDVRAGLRAAFLQQWNPNARRVVVLAGDAPPHNADWKSLLGEVRQFASNGRSFVHTIVTSPETAGEDTHKMFGEIAKAGKGACTGLQAHDRIMQQVLALAFGREYDRDLAAVHRRVADAEERVDVEALDLARTGGPRLAGELRKNPVPRTLLNALVRRPREAVALELIDLLADKATPGHSRHAIAAVLQRVLELSVPPIDPLSAECPGERDLDRLRRACGRLPD
ncbi:MAG TPA: FHA domain-containing protein [Planctomycetota bacterium]